MDTLPKGLQNIMNNIMCDNVLSSWRIYGDQYITVSLKFVSTSSTAEHSHDGGVCLPASRQYSFRRKSPGAVARDKIRQENWMSDKNIGVKDTVMDTCDREEYSIGNNSNENRDISMVLPNINDKQCASMEDKCFSFETGYASASTPGILYHDNDLESNNIVVKSSDIILGELTSNQEVEHNVPTHQEATGQLEDHAVGAQYRMHTNSQDHYVSPASFQMPPETRKQNIVSETMDKRSQTNTKLTNDEGIQTIRATPRKCQTPRWSDQDKQPQTIPIPTSSHLTQCDVIPDTHSQSTMTEVHSCTADIACGSEGHTNRHVQTSIPQMKDKCVGTKYVKDTVQHEPYISNKNQEQMVDELDQTLKSLLTLSESIT